MCLPNPYISTFFWVYGCCRVVINVSKISIHYSWVNGRLVFSKLTPSICFMLLFNHKALIVICHIFFNTIRICPCMSKHSKGGKVFSKYMDKGHHITMHVIITR